MALSKKLYTCVILCVLVCAAGVRASEATAGATSTDKIKHIVVLMLENRSFDHMIGFLRGNNTDIDGCTAERAATDAACTCPEDPTQAGSPRVPVDNEAIYVQPADPGHSLQQTTDQLYGFGPVTGAPAPMSGFIKSYAPIMDNSTGTADGSFIMKCFAPSHVPVISTLASEFTLIDHWYSGIPGPTEVNRAYANSATSHGYISNDEIVEHLGMPQRTIFESLADAGADWNVYYHDYASVLLFRYPWLHLDHIHKWDKFADDVAKGDLPQYTWLEPQYYDSGSKAAQDQHPDHDVAEGELLMKEVYDALRASPMWNETLLLVTYDEHGGFFDHVPPLNNVPNPDGLNSTNPPFNFTRIGVRVPAIVVSPWVEPGVVVHGPAEGNGNAFCHSSIPATVRKLFAPSEPFLTKRDAWASTFDELLTLDAPRTNCPSSMPTPALHRDLVPHLLPKLDGKMPLSDLQKGFVQTVAAKMGDSSMTDDVLAKPPPAEWGQYGYGYRMEGSQPNDGEDGEGLDAKLADEMYLRAWREQSLSHAALIDDGDDERLLRLASHLRPLPLSDGAPTSSDVARGEGIHPVARLCAARGKAYDAISNPHRAVPFLRAALAIDARCVEAWDYVVTRRLLTPEEEREWMASLNFGEQLGGMGISWLKDAYLARLRGGAGSVALPPTALDGQAGAEAGANVTLGASPVPRSDLQSPSMLSIGSPDFAGGAADGAGDGPGDMPNPFATKSTGATQTIDEAFRSLSLRHNLGRSPDVLSHAAMRAYAAHDLRSALAYCTALDAIDPYCRTAGYVHVATLVGLNLKRRLFQLAHRLVDTDPKDALAWFAVGSYYYACRRYDLAQRHFSRSTRLDPGCAECWIGFGCSFAVCDESDQALASFRAAQNKHPGSHVPLLYMGIEYLRTNHLSLAGHFLTSAQKVDPSDVLCCNELGVWSYRQGDMEDASFWFMKALRLHVRAELSALTSTDEALGMDGYILLNGTGGEGRGGTQQDTSASNADTCTPYAKRRSNDGDGPPLSTVLCAVKTPSGQEIAASMFNEDTDKGMTDNECIERCKDQFWEPTIFNLGQSYRKMKRYNDAIVCFEKCSSLNPGNYAAYAALGFAKHLGGDVDGAIDSYHEALSRKPEDPFTSEMLTRALAEAVTYPPSLAMLSSLPSGGEGRSGGVGSSILKKMGGSGNSQPAISSGIADQDTSHDVDMSLA